MGTCGDGYEEVSEKWVQWVVKNEDMHGVGWGKGGMSGGI